MEATAKVISRSSAWVPGRPELPQRVQVVIRAGKLSVTKHLRYEGGQYVGRAYDYRNRTHVRIAFPIGIVNGELKEEVRLKLAA
jgi:hypothetical protein